MDSDYLVIDKFQNKKGEDTTEFKEYDGKLIIKQYSGINCDNFIIKKFDGKKIEFSFFKLNGIFYISINGAHIIDYKRFINIQQISKLENINDINSLKIKNRYIGDLIIHNCDPEIFQKALKIMGEYMKTKSTFFSNFMYFMLSL